MTQPKHEIPVAVDKERAYLAAYAEICKSYHAIDDFRMKLLGLLPLASIVAVAFLDTSKILATAPHDRSSELISFAAIFAAMLTLALFGYEVRGIQRSHNLITEGKHLEQLLGVRHGQFHVCEEEHASSPLRALNAKLMACVIYSLVFLRLVVHRHEVRHGLGGGNLCSIRQRGRVGFRRAHVLSCSQAHAALTQEPFDLPFPLQWSTPHVATVLDKALKRQVTVDGADYTVAVDPEGIR
jgi:hypothetical protein